MAKPRGDPTRPPQEATICSTGSLLELEMAMWKLKLVIWKLNMALGKLQMAIWNSKWPFGSLKMNILKPKTAKTGKMQVLDPKLSKMAAPNFEPNSLCGPSTVFQGRWPNQGGTPQDPPKKRQFVAQAAFWS